MNNQSPNTKSQRTTDPQEKLAALRRLEFGASLVIGVWVLELSTAWSFFGAWGLEPGAFTL